MSNISKIPVKELPLLSLMRYLKEKFPGTAGEIVARHRKGQLQFGRGSSPKISSGPHADVIYIPTGSASMGVGLVVEELVALVGRLPARKDFLRSGLPVSEDCRITG